MLDNELVIDAVAHGFDVSSENRAAHCSEEMYGGFQRLMHDMVHVPMESTSDKYQLSKEDFVPRTSPEALANILFVESDVDVAFYHHVPIRNFFANGISRLDTGFELRDMAPNRVFLYGGVDTFMPTPQHTFDEMEMFAERGCVGFKFYPSDGVVDPKTGLMQTMLYDDPERAYPYFEKARELGVTRLAFHKAFPLGPSVEAVRPGDLLSAAIAFPDLTFEIVHTGMAFTEETAMELMCAHNLYANLELSAGLIVRRPRKFAEVLGYLIQQAGHERILFASGTTVTHVEPMLQAFWDFQMPLDLQEGYGYPEITKEMKLDILGRNMARLHGLDTDQIKTQIKDDEWSQKRAAGKEEPWRVKKEQARATVGAGV